MYDRTITRLVEKNCLAHRLFTTPPTPPAPPAGDTRDGVRKVSA